MVKFSKENIDEIKLLVDDSDFDDEEKLKKMSLEGNTITLGRLFVICHNHVKQNMHLFYDTKYNQKILDYLSTFDFTPELINLTEEYGDGNQYGSYMNGEKIKNVVNNERDKVHEFISFFFLIFGGDE